MKTLVKFALVLLFVAKLAHAVDAPANGAVAPTDASTAASTAATNDVVDENASNPND